MEFTRAHVLSDPVEVSTSTLGSSLGTGGMETKLIAAEIATAAGVTTIITSSKEPRSIFKIIEYNNALKSGTSTPLHTTSDQSSLPLESVDSFSLPPRPPHTLFKPSPTPLRDLKSWTTHTLFPSGTVIIDSGAHHVLSKRESGGRLLAAGVLGVRGAFASGQAVRICVRRQPPIANHVEQETEKALARELYLKAMVTEPNTPTLSPSETSDPGISTIDEMMDADPSPSIDDVDNTPAAQTKTLPEEDRVVLQSMESVVDDWELEEVGRGLANYNSAQIDRVKGLKR